MPRFRATYVVREGRLRRAGMDAVDRASLVANLERRGRAFVVEIRPANGRGSAPKNLRVRIRLLLVALDSLEFMLMNGATINAALRVLADSAPPGSARRFWTEVVARVEATGSFSGALRQFPGVFNESMAGVIAAHEEAGRLVEGIRQVRAYLAQMDEIRRESARGLAYPATVGAVGCGAATVLAFFTLPRFARMLREIGVAHLHPVTRLFFGLSDFVTLHPGGALALAALPWLMVAAARRPRLRALVDRWALRLPVIRRAVEALALARICLTYRALAESGIRVVEALEFCRRVSGNSVLALGLDRVIASLRDNEPIGRAFERAGVFAPEMVLAVSGGEGNLPAVFGRLADYYLAEARHRVGLALRLLEPALLVLVLIWVLGLALAVVLPVIDIIDEIH
jgi:type II secretory pathway component PulF